MKFSMTLLPLIVGLSYAVALPEPNSNTLMTRANGHDCPSNDATQCCDCSNGNGYCIAYVCYCFSGPNNDYC
ncbi:hypothetical protein AWENTII_011060 [Aspergillus wentii]|nr:hypothetical protein MW887_003582 [Aspergillus wentii]